MCISPPIACRSYVFSFSFGGIGSRSIAVPQVRTRADRWVIGRRGCLRPGSVVQDERHLHGNAILGNFAVGDAGLLLEDMQARDPTQRLAGAGYSLTHSVINAVR